jgi:uncharacterized protein (TIGR03086 family)
MHIDDVVARDARAVQGSARVVAQVRDEDLPRPTPCAGWTLADLITHMTVQHNGFAAAAEGNGADLAQWSPARVDPSAVLTEYARAADRVMAAFADASVPDRKFCLPEVSAEILFPARQAIGFHLVDYVTHGWDVARSLGLDYDIDQDVLDAALAIAQAVPDDYERRQRPGAPFAPRRPSPAGNTLDQVLSLLGRDPAWSAPTP